MGAPMVPALTTASRWPSAACSSRRAFSSVRQPHRRTANRGRCIASPEIDLASRLSFFLWSSIPDDELLGLAEEGRLSESTVLAAQLARLLADPRARTLVENFGGQWLHLRNVADWTPDPERFEHFDESLRHAFQRETALFLERMIRDDRSVLELIDADYTFSTSGWRTSMGLRVSTGATSAASRWLGPSVAVS